MVGPMTGHDDGTPMALITLGRLAGPAFFDQDHLSDRHDHPAARALDDPERDELGGRVARPHSAEPSVKSTTDTMNSRRAPYRLAAQPVTGITAASESR